MSNSNPLAGLIGQYYSDSDDENDEVSLEQSAGTSLTYQSQMAVMPNAAITPTPVTHPAPVTHCAWSACYDESTGYTYYWNQYTNEVTWEAPAEYLLALKVASHKNTVGQSEVSAEEWLMYQQALEEKQKNSLIQKHIDKVNNAAKAVNKQTSEDVKMLPNKTKEAKTMKNYVKRKIEDDSDDEKIELITSYHNSDSESNDEVESPKKESVKLPAVETNKQNVFTKKTQKKVVKSSIVGHPKARIEYGPTLPPNQEYTVPIGPEMPTELLNSLNAPTVLQGIVNVDTSKKELLVEKDSAVICAKEELNDKNHDQREKCENEATIKELAQTEEKSVNQSINKREEISDKEECVSKLLHETSIATEEHADQQATTESSTDDVQNLMKEIIDKAKLLENLGGEVPTEVKELMEHENKFNILPSPSLIQPEPQSIYDTNIDDLLEEIEKKELPKRKKRKATKVDIFSDEVNLPSSESRSQSPNIEPQTNQSPVAIVTDSEKPENSKTPELIIAVEKRENNDKEYEAEMNTVPNNTVPDQKPDLFPSAKNIELNQKEVLANENNCNPEAKILFPCAKSIESIPLNDISKSITNTFPSVSESSEVKSVVEKEKKSENIYLSALAEVDVVPKKKKRISVSVLPDKKVEQPSYTTKYAQFIEGFSTERRGLGFSGTIDSDSKKATINCNKQSIKFTKGETINEIKEDKEKNELKELTDILMAKLKFLNMQAVQVSPVQELMIQMQCLSGAWEAGALGSDYWGRWASECGAALARLESQAAPLGWRAAFNRVEGRYVYRRESDGHEQWDYPVESGHAEDMDISTTPPHSTNYDERAKPDTVTKPVTPVLPTASIAAPPPPPPPPATAAAPSSSPPPPPPPSWSPPPQPPPPPPPPHWSAADPPPPGCEDFEGKPQDHKKPEITDELMSFYNDIAQIEQVSVKEAPLPPVAKSRPPSPEAVGTASPDHHEKDVNGCAKSKKKSKVKISSSVGLKHKTVSNLVAKWQQVAEEIHSD